MSGLVRKSGRLCQVTLLFSSMTAGAFSPVNSGPPPNNASGHHVQNEQPVDSVPTRKGIWEQSLFRKGQLITGPFQHEELCSGLFLYKPFASVPSTVEIGSVVPDRVMVPDIVRKLPDGRFRVAGGLTTTKAGDVTYTHLITMHGDASYQDQLTLTLHANKHPVVHFYTGSGHWVAPCPAESK